MSLFEGLWLALCAFLAGFSLTAAFGVRRVLARGRALPLPERWPALLVIRPCEGHEPELAQRVDSALTCGWPGPLTVVVAHGGELPPALNRPGLLLRKSPPPPAVVNRKAWHLVHGLAAAEAEGLPFEVVLPIDADVEVTLPLLESLVRGALAPGVACAFSPPLQRGDARASWWGEAALGAGPHAFAALAALAELTGSVPTMVGCAVAMRRESLVHTRGFRAALEVIGDDLALAACLAPHGRIALAEVACECLDPTLTLAGLTRQLARWIRVATAHRPHLAATYPLFIAPLPLLALLAPLLGSIGPMGLGLVWASRTVLAATLRRGLQGHVARAPLDPWAADLLWWAALITAFRPGPTLWRGRPYAIGAGGRLVAPEGPR